MSRGGEHTLYQSRHIFSVFEKKPATLLDEEFFQQLKELIIRINTVIIRHAQSHSDTFATEYNELFDSEKNKNDDRNQLTMEFETTNSIVNACLVSNSPNSLTQAERENILAWFTDPRMQVFLSLIVNPTQAKILQLLTLLKVSFGFNDNYDSQYVIIQSAIQTLANTLVSQFYEFGHLGTDTLSLLMTNLSEQRRIEIHKDFVRLCDIELMQLELDMESAAISRVRLLQAENSNFFAGKLYKGLPEWIVSSYSAITTSISFSKNSPESRAIAFVCSLLDKQTKYLNLIDIYDALFNNPYEGLANLGCNMAIFIGRFVEAVYLSLRAIASGYITDTVGKILNDTYHGASEAELNGYIQAVRQSQSIQHLIALLAAYGEVSCVTQYKSHVAAISSKILRDFIDHTDQEQEIKARLKSIKLQASYQMEISNEFIQQTGIVDSMTAAVLVFMLDLENMAQFKRQYRTFKNSQSEAQNHITYPRLRVGSTHGKRANAHYARMNVGMQAQEHQPYNDHLNDASVQFRGIQRQHASDKALIEAQKKKEKRHQQRVFRAKVVHEIKEDFKVYARNELYQQFKKDESSAMSRFWKYLGYGTLIVVGVVVVVGAIVITKGLITPFLLPIAYQYFVAGGCALTVAGGAGVAHTKCSGRKKSQSDPALSIKYNNKIFAPICDGDDPRMSANSNSNQPARSVTSQSF